MPEQHGGGLRRGQHRLRLDAALELLVQTFNRVRGARALPLVGRQPREREELLAGFLQAVGDGAAFEPPFANEVFATRCHFLRVLRVDHVSEVRADLLCQPLQSMRNQITEFVHRAALYENIRLQTSERLLEPRRPAATLHLRWDQDQGRRDP